MRILFNASAALPGTSGEVHTVGLLSRLAGLMGRHDLVLLSTPEQAFLRDRLPDLEHYVAPELRGGALARSARLQLRLHAIGVKARADVIYNKGNFFAPLAGRQVCFMENSNPFSTLRLGEPLWYRTRNYLLRLMSDEALKKAAAVIFPTEHARRLIASRALLRSPAFVVPYGWELPEPLYAEPPQRPYLLCVSSILPYKNLSVVVDALAILRKRGTFDGDLVIVGVSGVSGGGYYHQLMTRRIHERGVEAHVRMIPPVATGRLAALYRGAHALLMPSIEESFGIPVIEAMGLGTPVVAARVEGADCDRYFIPFEEICGPAAEYFNPFDATTCADAVERASGAERRAQLESAGLERAQGYSWRAAAEATARVFAALS